MSLQLLANSSISQSRFALSESPIEESIIVTIDSVEHTDWLLDSSTNEVILQSNIPSSGSEITIEYFAEPNCELITE